MWLKNLKKNKLGCVCVCVEGMRKLLKTFINEKGVLGTMDTKRKHCGGINIFEACVKIWRFFQKYQFYINRIGKAIIIHVDK